LTRSLADLGGLVCKSSESYSSMERSDHLLVVALAEPRALDIRLMGKRSRGGEYDCADSQRGSSILVGMNK
jgi:hypothetical protein